MKTRIRPATAGHAWAAVAGLVLASSSAVAQPSNLDQWIEVETPHVALLSDAGPERAAEVAVRLEQFRAAFALLAPGLDLDAPAPTQMIAFQDAEHFAPYQRGGGRGVAVLGQFLSSPDGNILTLNADPRHPAALKVIYHEYVHYLVGSNLPDVPRWFNEGLAEYYSSFVIEDDAVRIGRAVPRHVAWLGEHGVPSLEALLDAGDARPHGADEVGAFYAGSWLLVHYLLSGDGERLDRAAALLARLAGGAEAHDAIAEIFDLRFGALEETLAAYLRSEDGFAEATLPTGSLPAFDVAVSRAPPARVLTALGDLTARLRDPAEAAAHFHLALSHDPQHAAALGGLAWARDLESRFDEAEWLYADAFALGTRDPVVHLRHGRHLLRTLDLPGEEGETAEDRAARARAAFERVTVIDPDFAEGWAMLGVAHLVGDVDPAAGIPSLERAVERLPARLDLIARLVELEARAGRFEQAEQRIEHMLVGRGDDQVVAAAREDVARRRLLAGAQEALDDGRVDDGLRLLDEAVSVTSDPALRESLARRLSVLQEAFER